MKKTILILIILTILLALNVSAEFNVSWENKEVVSLWHFDEGAGSENLPDTTGFVLNIDDSTFDSDTPTEIADSTYSMDLDTDGDVLYNASANLNINLSHSICFWFNASVIQTDDYVLFYTADASNSAYIWFENSGGNYLFWSFKGGGNDDRIKTPWAGIPTGSWQHFCFTKNSSGTSGMGIYLNGTPMAITSVSSGGATNLEGSGTFYFGSYNDADAYTFKANIDDLVILNESLTSSEVAEIYADNMGPGAPGVSINISNPLPVTNSQHQINTLNFNLTGNFSNNVNCSLYINSTFNQTTNYTAGNDILVSWNVTLSNGPYQYYINCSDVTGGKQTNTINFLIDTTTPDFLAILQGNNTFWTGFIDYNITLLENVSFYELNISDSCGNFYSNSSDLSSPVNVSFGVFNCSIGSQTANITFCDGLFSPLTCLIQYFTWENTARLNITGYNAITTAPVSNFTIYRNGTYIGSTTTGVYSLDNLTEGDYNISIDALGYEFKSEIININETIESLNFSLYTENSLRIFIRDADTNLNITENVSIVFTNNLTEWTNYTNTSYFFIDDLNPGEYVLGFSSDNYSIRTYSVTIGNKTSQELNVYLAKSVNQTIFTITDQDTSEVLEGVSVSMFRVVGGSWVIVESGLSDITGKIEFNYVEDVNYRFYLSNDGYEDYIFYLTPILYDTYDIQMTKSSVINYSQDYDKISFIYSPTTFNNNNVTTFNFIISSPEGVLTEYGINLTYPGGSNSTSGVNAIGEQLTLNVNVSNATIYDNVKLEFYYETTIDGRKNYTFYLPIEFPDGTTSYTFIDNKSHSFGLGIFERMLIATIIILFIVGIATLVGQSLPGLALGLFVFAYMVIIGFIPLWIVLPTMFIGVMFLMWKSGG